MAGATIKTAADFQARIRTVIGDAIWSGLSRQAIAAILAAEAALATPAPSTSTEEALRAENARLREALNFYADPDGAGYDVEVTDYGLSMEKGPIVRDGGECARNALSALAR